jgi:hypothetical protein
MSLFSASKTIPVTVPDLAPVARAVMKRFGDWDFEVGAEPAGPHRWEIGIHKGGIFQAVIGMKTALRIRIETVGSSTQVSASIGLLESQGVSSAVSMLACWPILITQTWGLVKQAKLDEEAIAVAEEALLAAGAHSAAARFCHDCGASIETEAIFCPGCGVRL